MRFHSLALSIGMLAASAGAFGGDLPVVDQNVRPGDDFYQYVNGAWLAATEIPADRSSMSDGALLSEQADQRTREIIQQTAQDKNATADARKIADFYNAFMDEASIEKLGLAPLEPQLREIAAIRDRKALSRVLGSQLRADVDALNNTEFYTDQSAGPVGGAGSRRSGPLRPVPSAGRPRHAGPRLLPRRRTRDGRDSRQVHAASRQGAGARRDSRCARRKPRAFSRWKNAWRLHTPRVPIRMTWSRPTTIGRARTSTHERRDSTGGNISRPRDSTGRATSSSGIRMP